MKKIILTLALVLVGWLTLTLVFEEEGLWAKSKSTTFEMTSDVFCGTGGKSQSTNFVMKNSAGAQGSPIGPQSSTSFQGYGGWIYTTQPTFIRGDVNRSGVVELGDVVFLITYVFKFGPAPSPLEAGDVNCNGAVDLGDVVYLITYLYKSGPPPCPAKGGKAMVKASMLTESVGHAQMTLVLKNVQSIENKPSLSRVSPTSLDEVKEVSVEGKFDQDLAGVQVEISFDPKDVTLLDPALTPLTRDLQLFCGTKDGIQKIGVLDLTGEKLIPKGEGALVYLRARGDDLSSIKVQKLLLVDANANYVALELPVELNLQPVNNSSQAKRGFPESKPEHFSLSQNHPNPFNPQTCIGYALPQDAYVKLVIYNVLGQKVKTLVNESQSAGYKTAWWDGKDENGEQVASGLYFYRLEADKFSEVKKMMLVK